MKTEEGPIRLLLVDDSPLFIDAFLILAETDKNIDIVGVAKNGKDALHQVTRLAPDVVVMDVQMPVMDGLEAVEWIMSTRPTPIVLLTGDPARQAQMSSFDALSRGALDFMPKPTLNDSPSAIAKFFEHIRLLASIPVVHHRRSSRPTTTPDTPRSRFHARGARTAIGIVASTGGPNVLAECLGALPEGFTVPILVVQHLSIGFHGHLVSWLDSSSHLTVKIAVDGEPAVAGQVYIAPGDQHLMLGPKGVLCLDDSPPVGGHRPSGTLLLESLARVAGASGLGLILTGMGNDGSDGLLALRQAGGTCLAQDEATSVVFGMPKAALNCGAVTKTVPRWALAEALCQAAGLSSACIPSRE